MSGFNKVILIGNLTADPEMQYTANGTARTKFSIAVNRKYKDSNGEAQEDVTFIPITVWGKQAENASTYLSKGRPVMVEGRLRIASFENEQGEKRKFTEVIAQNIQFLGSRDTNKTEQSEMDEVPF